MDSEEPPEQGWAVNDVRQCMVTINYGCGYGDSLTGLFSATMMVVMCVIAVLLYLVPDPVFFFPLSWNYLRLSCLSCVFVFSFFFSTWCTLLSALTSEPFSKYRSTIVNPSQKRIQDQCKLQLNEVNVCCHII